jgi:hypothetical protein
MAWPRGGASHVRPRGPVDVGLSTDACQPLSHKSASSPIKYLVVHQGSYEGDVPSSVAAGAVPVVAWPDIPAYSELSTATILAAARSTPRCRDDPRRPASAGVPAGGRRSRPMPCTWWAVCDQRMARSSLRRPAMPGWHVFHDLHSVLPGP